MQEDECESVPEELEDTADESVELIFGEVSDENVRLEIFMSNVVSKRLSCFAHNLQDVIGDFMKTLVQNNGFRAMLGLLKRVKFCMAAKQAVREQLEVQNPIGYWESALNTIFRSLATLAMEILAIPATSAPIERVFSQAGLAASRHQSRTEILLLNSQLCKTGFCIPQSWKCDGEADCVDHSDENDCPTTSTNRNVTCSDKEFKCKNGAQCISSYWRCDGDADCFDESDEKDCDTSKAIKCSATQKMCANAKECVDIDVICDGNSDCTDGSDELNCTTVAKAITCNKEFEFQCPNETPMKCIPYSNLCRSGMPNNDCTIKSVCNTEIVNCNTTIDNYCECRKMGTKGKLCTCLSGLKNVEINALTLMSVKHLESATRFARIHSEATNCRAVGKDPMLLLSNRAAIRQYDIVTNKYHPLISSLESAVAMDFWHKNNTLIWSDVSKEKIMICHIGNQTMLNDIGDCLEHETDRTPDGLAIDWVHGLLFWTDTGMDRISHLDEPRAIAVDPSAGLIFWTDWGARARIERAGMDGENRVEIISGDIVRWPNGLAVDILDRKVYWADAKMKLISSCDYWGKNVRTVIHSHQHLRHPFSLAVFEEKLYWTDWDQEGVLTVNKFHGNDVKTLMKGISGPMTVRVYHKQAQPEHINKCERSDCEHLCLPRAMFTAASREQESDILGLTYSCSCDLGFKISTENSSMCISLDTIAGIMPLEDPSGFPLTYLLLVAIVAIVLILGVVHYRRQPARFSVLQFDNPIYRRTIEDLDAELENPVGDNTLGAISILPVASFNGQSATKSDSNAKLVWMYMTVHNIPMTSHQMAMLLKTQIARIRYCSSIFRKDAFYL
uniref:HAT C-terminal dimerisation domain-containing protein n=1 Tax=Ditylenchus dipsaci TaxID=166011 RepID=A0A915DGL5_9BILA